MSTSTARRRRRASPHTDTRSALVRSGVELFTEKGFQAAGLEEILSRVGVPKGSFYYFFSSKQQFGEEVIESYAAYFHRKLERILQDESLSPLRRVEAFAEDAKHGMQKYAFQRGCLIGNLAQELGGLNDTFRVQLEQVLKSWQSQLAQCLRAAIAQGELPDEADPEALAEFFWIGWEGAVLRSKLTRNNDPLDKFLTFFLATAKSSIT